MSLPIVQVVHDLVNFLLIEIFILNCLFYFLKCLVYVLNCLEQKYEYLCRSSMHFKTLGLFFKLLGLYLFCSWKGVVVLHDVFIIEKERTIEWLQQKIKYTSSYLLLCHYSASKMSSHNNSHKIDIPIYLTCCDSQWPGFLPFITLVITLILIWYLYFYKLRLGNKLTQRYILFQNNKMKVYLAAQLFSRSVAESLRYLYWSGNVLFQDSDMLSTAEFIEFINCNNCNAIFSLVEELLIKK